MIELNNRFDVTVGQTQGILTGLFAATLFVGVFFLGMLPDMSSDDTCILFHVVQRRVFLTELAERPIYTTQIWQRRKELADAYNRAVDKKIRLFVNRQKDNARKIADE